MLLRVSLATLVLAGSGCGPAKANAPPSAAAPSNGATTSSSHDPASSGGGASAPKAASTGASAGGAGAGATGLVELSTAEPDCALDKEGRPWRVVDGRLERAPVAVEGAKAIACASSHTCVLAADATVKCWGDNVYGALGDGTLKASPDAAVAVKDLANVAELDVAFTRTCARTTSGEVYCWGDREFAKAGDGSLKDNKGREKPLAGKPVLGLSGATSLGISLVHACATTGDGSVMCWGQCRSGACGQPPRPPWLPRATKAPKEKDMAAVFAGEDATCGVDKAGGVSCWGTSKFGVLGDAVADDKPHDAPAKIALPGPAAEVAVGIGGHACARLQSGAVLCWGHNDHGQLGDGTTADKKTPVAVKGVDKATRIAVGDGDSCALAQGGRLFCWGQKRTAQGDAHEPVEVKPASK